MLRALLTVLLVCCLSPAVADQRASAQRELEAAQRDIRELQQRIAKVREEKGAAEQQLARSDREIAKIAQQIATLEQQLQTGEAEIARLGSEQQALLAQQAEQQRLVALQIRAAYQSGRQEYLKLLLNQQQPEQFSRNLTYHDYLSRARNAQLATFQSTLEQLQNVEGELATQHALLAGQRLELQERRSALDSARQTHQQLVAKLSHELGEGDRRLQARQQEQARLEQLLKTIEETLARQAREAEQRRLAEEQRRLAEAQARAQAEAESQARRDQRPAAQPDGDAAVVTSSAAHVDGPFARARGRLPWPVSGPLLANFGSPRGDERLKWDGVLIGAPAGSPVRAIHAGRVVFSDWLRGSGQLLIIDHGDGYLSLYGHNQRLLKQAGDRVQAGETIATVGDSGGQERPALYFAIRQQGQPSDPRRWCSTRG
ncbi:peptidoglycan DD-metalloendopeptidase family protein [Pseudomonas sp. NW5]|uniref:murein hydrolase activator EnvC family protein n=1 Tax=Pseudomonas sp. NW5 TaxID=2934934 RepID=UPI0020204946|nr:peptidoglycan DD-metalloendopeptidase family protein [Pseudomonas sp. NW5]MCL7462360.1 peptidoglycan DD-metalloendopeptidase family protein [Pseudomonas sp. NW5]